MIIDCATTRRGKEIRTRAMTRVSVRAMKFLPLCSMKEGVISIYHLILCG